ncbi:ACP S-malonyltransferase [Streptomyces sp. NPDC052051]|uniref:ACP S-malonyltransferase n=1 Tax=Streptomyces sp. NPDC052051 TaxID=3154649 RepID=UPI00341CBC79
MTLGYLLGGGVGTEPHGVELYKAYPVMRELYDQVSGWTGLTVGQILEEELPTALEERQSTGTVREAALAMAVHDIFAEQGLRPGAIGGLSLGAMAAAALVGAVSREELFRMLVHSRHVPEPAPDAPRQGIALAFVPAGAPETDHPGHGQPDIHPSGDFGVTSDGSQRILMLSGLAAALEQVAAAAPPGTVVPLPDRLIAVHSPLRQPYRDFMAPHIDAMTFATPRLPLLSCLEQRALVSADDVRDLFHRNATDPISLVDVYTGMKGQGVDLAFVMGPSIPEGILDFPFPVVHVDKPEHIEQAVTTAYELGIDLTAPPATR